jgi:hypothetical protein
MLLQYRLSTKNNSGWSISQEPYGAILIFVSFKCPQDSLVFLLSLNVASGIEMGDLKKEVLLEVAS